MLACNCFLAAPLSQHNTASQHWPWRVKNEQRRVGGVSASCTVKPHALRHTLKRVMNCMTARTEYRFSDAFLSSVLSYHHAFMCTPPPTNKHTNTHFLSSFIFPSFCPCILFHLLKVQWQMSALLSNHSHQSSLQDIKGGEKEARQELRRRETNLLAATIPPTHTSQGGVRLAE